MTEAERGDQFAIEAYQEALNRMLPPTAIDLITEQRDAMLSDKDRIRTVGMGYS